MPPQPFDLSHLLGPSNTAPTTPDEEQYAGSPNPHDERPRCALLSPWNLHGGTVALCKQGKGRRLSLIDYVPTAWPHRIKISEVSICIFPQPQRIPEGGARIEIGKRLAAVLSPPTLRIGGYWSTPVEAWPIECVGETGVFKTKVWVPEQGSLPIGAADNASREVQQATFAPERWLHVPWCRSFVLRCKCMFD